MITKPLNILIVASWYPNEQHPTNGSFIEEQAQMFKDAGHRVIVLHPFLTGTFFSSIFKKNLKFMALWNNISVIRVGIKPVFPKQRKISYDKLYQECKKALKKFNISVEHFDLIHSHTMFMGGVIAMNLAKEFKKNHFHTEHTSGLIFRPEQYNKEDENIIKNVFESSKNVFFVSQFALEMTLAQWRIVKKDTHVVLPNMVNKIFFQHSNSELMDKPFSYIIICGLIPIKRVDLILKGWSELLIHYPDSQLTIAGEGPEKNKLESIVNQLNLSKSVRFLPKLHRQEVLQQISIHHVLISSSKLETFGLTIAEAQALGKPVVATDSGGVRDIVDEETGIITGQSIEELTIGLIEIQKNYKKYNPQKIREKIKQKFASEIILERLMGFMSY